MVDFFKDGWSFDFTNMVVIHAPTRTKLKLAVRSGVVGYLSGQLGWFAESHKVQEAYKSWKQKR